MTDFNIAANLFQAANSRLNPGFNIESAFFKQFGLPLQPSFKVDHKPVNQNQGEINYPFDIAAATKQPEKSTNYGSNYYATDIYGRYYFMPVSISDYLLPFPVISIDCGKDIVSTPMVERQGSVHEIINTNDFIINIRGFIADPNNNYPESEIIALLQNVFVPNKSLTIKSVLTDIFLQGNNSVVVKSLKFPPVKGIIGVKPYELDLVSDLIFDLENVPAV